jgi:hypothetical protein
MAASPKTPDPELERLASAVTERFAASAGAARLLTTPTQPVPGAEPSVLNRLASAVAQRLAARSGPNIDLVASAVAHRLAASQGAAPLVRGAARQFAGNLAWSEPDLDKLVQTVAAKLGKP